MSRIFAFGDSNTYGIWDSKGGWVHRLREVLDEKNLRDPGFDWFIYNLGIPGDTSTDLVKRFTDEITLEFANEAHHF